MIPVLAENFISKQKVVLAEKAAILSFFRINYIPCNIYSMYVVAVSVRSGKEFEVYSDAFSKVILSMCLLYHPFITILHNRCTLKEMVVYMAHCGHVILRT